jgi:AP-3 complex subunit delta
LFTFIRKDLNAHRPKSENGFGFQDAASSSFDPIAEPRFPKSLYLIRPLFTSHELNPVAPTAQASVPIPDGLHLDAWIVPSQQERVMEEDDDDVVRKVKKGRKGKGKETNGTRVKSGKRRQRDDDPRDTYTPPEPEVETEEERAERERVCLPRQQKLFFFGFVDIADTGSSAESRAFGTDAGRPVLHRR